MKKKKKVVKKKESKWLEIYCEMYKLHVIVTWEQKIEKIIAHVKKRGGIALSDKWQKKVIEHMKGANGICMRLGEDNSDIFIWLKERPKKAWQYGILYHEIFHGVDFITVDHGLEGEMESRAYLFEYIVNECNKVLWK